MLQVCLLPGPCPCSAVLSFSLRQSLFVPKPRRWVCIQFRSAADAAYKAAAAAILGLDPAAASDSSIALDCQCAERQLFRITLRVDTPPVTQGEAARLSGLLAAAAASGELAQRVRLALWGSLGSCLKSGLGATGLGLCFRESVGGRSHMAR